MGFRKRISDGARSLGGKLGIVKEDGAGGEDTNRSPSGGFTESPDSEARDASATTGKTLNNHPDEIVVSLKKLKNELNTTSEIKSLEVKVGTQSCTLQTVIDTLKTDRNLAKQILITWIDQNYQNKMQNKSENMALVYCLVNFAFRKDFRNEVAVKFGSKNEKLKNKVIAFARKNSLGINQLTNMFKELKSKSNDIVKPIQDLESGRAGKARRANRKLLNKAKLAKETAKHKIRNKLKPTTTDINIPTQTATKDKQDETQKTCNLELITLSPKAQKQFDALKTKVYGYGFSTLDTNQDKPIITSCNTDKFLSQLKTLDHPDFRYLKIKIERFTSLDPLITLLQTQAPSGYLPYDNAFITDLLDTCEELKKQQSACDTTPPQQIKTTKQPQQVITFPKTVTYKQTKQFTDQQEMAEPEQIQSRSKPDPNQQSPSDTNIFPKSLNPDKTPAPETSDPAESFIIDKCTSILSDSNAKYENAAKALKEIQSNQLTQNLRPVLCKLPDPLAPTTFPKDVDLPGLSQKSYSYLKQLWEKTKTLAQQEGITNPPSSGKRITANFPISAPNANNLQHISFSAPNFHPDPKTDKQTQQQPELTDQQKIDDDNDKIITICQEKDLLNEETPPLNAIISELNQLQTSLQITSLKNYFTQLINGLNNTDTLDYQNLPKQPKELDNLAYNQVTQLWKKAQDLLIWQNISSYIHTNVQQITNTANTLKNLKDQFQTFLDKNKATKMQGTLRTILDCLNRTDFTTLNFWTKKTLDDCKIHITDEAYKTLSEFWDKAKTLASSQTNSRPIKVYKPTNLKTHSSTTQITTDSTKEQQNPPEPQDQKTKDDPPPNDNEKAEDPPPPPPEDDDNVPPPTTENNDDDKIPPPPDDDPPMQEDYNLINSAWSKIDTKPNLTLSEILNHLKTCQTQAHNNDVKTYLQTLITHMNKTDFLQQDPPTAASRGSISRDGGQDILTTLDKIWEKAKSVANNQHIDSD